MRRSPGYRLAECEEGQGHLSDHREDEPGGDYAEAHLAPDSGGRVAFRERDEPRGQVEGPAHEEPAEEQEDDVGHPKRGDVAEEVGERQGPLPLLVALHPVLGEEQDADRHHAHADEDGNLQMATSPSVSSAWSGRVGWIDEHDDHHREQEEQDDVVDAGPRLGRPCDEPADEGHHQEGGGDEVVDQVGQGTFPLASVRPAAPHSFTFMAKSQSVLSKAPKLIGLTIGSVLTGFARGGSGLLSFTLSQFLASKKKTFS